MPEVLTVYCACEIIKAKICIIDTSDKLINIKNGLFFNKIESSIPLHTTTLTHPSFSSQLSSRIGI